MKTMQVREFLRGGYRKLQGPTIVTSHSHILFTVMPHGTPLEDEKRWLSAMIDKTEPQKPVSDEGNR